MNAKTAAQRKADERKRHKEAGRVPVTVHVQPEYRDDVRELEAKLQRREKLKKPYSTKSKGSPKGDPRPMPKT